MSNLSQIGGRGGGGVTDHGLLSGLLDNDHPQYALSSTTVSLTSHTADTSIHFTEVSIDFANISNTGHSHQFSAITDTGHTHVELDITDLKDYAVRSYFESHTGDSSIHFTESSISFLNIANTAHTHPYSGISNTAHTHAFSSITNTAHTHSDGFGFRATGTTRNKWYTTPATSLAMATVATTAHRLYAAHFPIPTTRMVEAIAFVVTTSIGGKANIGIYDDLNCAPNNKIYDSGNITIDGTRAFSAFPMVVLTGGNLYWLALACQSGNTVRSIAVNSLIPCLGVQEGFGTTGAVNHLYSGLTELGTQLPLVLGEGMTEATNSATPAIFVRLSG